ncbi:nucleolar transcription factor 1-A-like [Kryptolebias marmoratus]|uniref:nucleolar transcription factor 1-A-like n=1 Tax=Kryptolebias marmoratus TaxID=37003 RepID=UPI0007F89307|nr:nucleolar transcription factor 1-A-like [Kryptolebias marmoratus]
MDESEAETIESGWTNENLMKLLSSMKGCIPEGEKTTNYHKGIKSVDWNKVAFPPFSPEECREKWANIMEKMRKLRSLTELIAEAEDVISDPLHNKKVHPEFPKRPLLPRASYFMANHRTFRKKHPGMGTQKFFKLLYRKFDKLPKEKRALYEQKYSIELLEYQKKMQDFGKQNKMRVKQVKMASPYSRDKEGFKDEDVPTRPPRNSYTLFCMDHSKNSEGTSVFGDKDLSQRWRDLGEAEKAQYNARWKELRERYTSEMQKYLSNFSESEWEQIVKKKGLTVPKILRRKSLRPGEPKMPSLVSYSYFYGEQMKLLKDNIPNVRERSKEATKHWKELSVREKERYKNKVREGIKRYSATLQTWFKTLKPAEQVAYLKDKPSKSEFLGVRKMAKKRCGKKGLQSRPPSDSEDEDLVDISDEEEEISNGYENVKEQEEEEEEDIICFEIN